MKMESIFHIHTEGTDFHAHAPADEMKPQIQEKLGLERVYAGLHFIDPGRPSERIDLAISLETLKKEGITPGVEFNIVRGESGWELDISPEEIRQLKTQHRDFLAIASIHAVKAFGYTKETDSENAPEQTADSMLEIYSDIIEKYGDSLDVLGHPFGYVTSTITTEHMQKLAELASTKGVALEINVANTGLYQLEDEGFLPSVEQATEWNPTLRFPEVLENTPVLLIIGGDFHGNSPLEKRLLKDDLTDEEKFPDSELTYPALRLAASVRRYFKKHKIGEERVVNAWNEERVSNWLNRSLQTE